MVKPETIPAFESHYRRWLPKVDPWEHVHKVARQSIVENWEDKVGYAVSTLASNLEMAAWMQVFQREFAQLKRRCEILEGASPITVPLETFAPKPYEVIKPLHVVVRMQNKQYIASFFDANLSASGDTEEEAVLNLKDIIIATYELLCGMDENRLGPGPLHQRQVLYEFLREKG